MKKCAAFFVAAAICMIPFSVCADTTVRTVTGTSDGGRQIAFEVTIAFAPTGGDFGAGTGTASVTFTLENISGLYPYQTPQLGNPVMTGFYFNVPEGASVAYTEARALAGSVIYSTGTTMLGVSIPPGCRTLSSDEVHSNWYELTHLAATGLYGIFTNSLETLEGIKGGFVDISVFSSCAPLGDIYSPLVIAGPVAFAVDLGNLDTSLDSAADFLALCSLIHGDDQQESALAGKFQGTDELGEGSGYAADAGYCDQVGTEEQSWGRIKSIYR